MNKGNRVQLEMKKILISNQIIDSRVHICKILEYDRKKERISLTLEKGILSDISLDAIYGCKVETENEVLYCEGRVKERYRDARGQVLELRIRNGFYKISIKSVDK